MFCGGARRKYWCSDRCCCSSRRFDVTDASFLELGSIRPVHIAVLLPLFSPVLQCSLVHYLLVIFVYCEQFFGSPWFKFSSYFCLFLLLSLLLLVSLLLLLSVLVLLFVLLLLFPLVFAGDARVPACQPRCILRHCQRSLQRAPDSRRL